jgi:hypothetical protein
MDEQPAPPKTLYDPRVYGDLEVVDSAKGVVVHSPDGSRWRVQVDNAGTITATEI